MIRSLALAHPACLRPAERPLRRFAASNALCR
jgi:hypothetical protein